MITLDPILTFLNFEDTFDISGVSRSKSKFGRLVFEQLKSKGYKVKAINPNCNQIEDEKVYKNLDEIPESVKRLIIVTPKHQTAELVSHASRNGFTHIWIQQSSETPESIALCKESNITHVTGHCIFMIAEPVKGIHSFHRSLKRFFGSFPKVTLS